DALLRVARDHVLDDDSGSDNPGDDDAVGVGNREGPGHVESDQVVLNHIPTERGRAAIDDNARAVAGNDVAIVTTRPANEVVRATHQDTDLLQSRGRGAVRGGADEAVLDLVPIGVEDNVARSTIAHNEPAQTTAVGLDVEAD